MLEPNNAILTDEDLDFCLTGENQDLSSFSHLPFIEFCERWLKIQDKDGYVVPFVLNRAQRDLAQQLEQHERILVLKARQLGVSTVIQAWHYYKVCQGNAKTSTICHDDDLTSELRKMVDRFHDHIPDEYRPQRKYDNAKETTYPALDSQTRISRVGGHSGNLSAGKRKGRGGTNTHIHATEIAFWADAEGVLSGAMQAGNPHIVGESTPNGMVGWFYERCMEALENRGVWTILFYPWWWDDEYCMSDDDLLALNKTQLLHDYTEDELKLIDEYQLNKEQINWRRYKKAELPKTFDQEYPEDPRTCFLASGTSYFGNVEHVYTAPINVKPIQGREYIAGLDFGQTEDFTDMVVLDKLTLKQVDYLHINNLDWQVMRTRIANMAHKWNNAVVFGEANSMGKTNIELLQNGEYAADGLQLYKGIRLTPFETTAASKPPLIQGLYHAIHELGLTLFDLSEIRHQIRAFISKQTKTGHWQYEAGGGAHDDTVIAIALAVWAQHNQPEIKTAEIPNIFGRF